MAVSVARQRQRTADEQTSPPLRSLICTTKVRNQEELMVRKPLMLAAAAGGLIMVQGAAVAQTDCGGIWAARCNQPKPPKTKPADKKAKDAVQAAGAGASTNSNST